MRENKHSKIAILGGGITGLTAAYCLAQRGHEITLYEKESHLGGLASGFKESHWDWPLERAYHHLFATDSDILDFAREIGFGDIFFQSPTTSSLYKMGGKYSSYPLDTPLDFLTFPLLSPIDKIRAGSTLAFLKLSPFISLFEKYSARSFLQKTMGEGVWKIMWQELFRKKYGKYAGNILATFIWARIKKRTKSLGYIKGGFQTFIDYLEKKNTDLGVIIKKGQGIDDVIQDKGIFRLGAKTYDVVISTLPTTIMAKVTKNLFSTSYLERFSKLKYLHAVNLIIESKTPLLEKGYWLNICTPEIPIMVLAQHTNFIDKKYYGGNHVLYIGNYVDKDDNLLKMDDSELLSYFLPHLKRINPKYEILNTKYYAFKAPWAQPIFDKDFTENKPNFITPITNFFIANLDMTYPYDRGTNYAVKLGKDVSQIVINAST